MRVIVVGMGVQGRKRFAVAGPDAVARVDPVGGETGNGKGEMGVGKRETGTPFFRTVQEVPLDSYDAAMVCTPDQAKIPVLEYLLNNGKHLLVEKPVIAESQEPILRLKEIAERKRVVCYTAYNHRFEPHIVRLKALLDSGALGRVYLAKFFYGNGTARDVRNSAWRDQDMGVFPDLGSHLLDWTLMLFGKPAGERKIHAAHRFENRAYDHFRFGYEGGTKPLAGFATLAHPAPALDFEMTLLSWRNTFRCDLFAENGSAHIDCLCKWGPSIYTVRKRILPSGRPTEETVRLECADPTWQAEYDHFKGLCANPSHNLDNDLWINAEFNSVRQSLCPTPPE